MNQMKPNPADETNPLQIALNALQVFRLDEHINTFLVDNDPQALKQATLACVALEKETKKTELWIEVQERKDGLYQAQLKDNPDKWDCGKSPRKAVHNLLGKCPHINLSSIIRVEFIHTIVP